MSRPPVGPLAGALISPLISPLIGAVVCVLAIALSIGVVLGPASAAPDTTDPRRAGSELDTDLTLEIARCEGCVITLLSYDGANPVYSSVPATVTEGSVMINLPSSRTAGMSVRVEPPWVTSSLDYATHVAWRYNGASIGDSVTFRDARAKRRASGCWAGTVNEAVTLTVKVRHVSFRGLPGAIAWAPVTESFVRPMERSRRGVLVSDDVLACELYR